MTTNSSRKEKQLRRELAAEGYRLWKVRQNSRYFAQYGPYTVLDKATQRVMFPGADIRQVSEWLGD